MYGLSKRVINGQGIHGADPPLAGQVEKDVANVSVGEFRVAAVEILDDVEVGIENEKDPYCCMQTTVGLAEALYG